MEFFKIRRDIPFMRYALVFNIISLATFLAAVIFLWAKGLNFSIEFTGGTVLEVSYAQAADVDAIRNTLEKAGYHDTQVQNFGSSRDVLIRMPLKAGESSAAISKEVLEKLQAIDKTAQLRRVEFVGPQVGSELAWDGALALMDAPTDGQLFAYDRSSRHGYFWVEDAGQLSIYERAAPLQTLFHWALREFGWQVVHAAGVGTEAGGVLLIGATGAGKSTTALSCLAGDGLRLLSDDKCLARLDPTPQAFAAYAPAMRNACSKDCDNR